MDIRPTSNCLLQPRPETRLFQPRAEDILSDEELLDLFRIIKQIIRKRPDAERLAKVIFCMFYSLGDHVKCYRPAHDDTILFRDDLNPGGALNAVRVSHNPSCCDISPAPPPSHVLQQQQAIQPLNSSDEQVYTMGQRWKDLGHMDNTTSYAKPLSVPYLTRSSPTVRPINTTNNESSDILSHQLPPVNDLPTAATHGIPPSSSSITTDTPILGLPSQPSALESSSSSSMLLDHSPSTTNDILMNSDHSSAVRPYTHFRPSYTMNTTPPTTSSIRYDERHDTPVDYTQHPLQNGDSSDQRTDPRYQQLNSMLHGPMTNTRIQPDPSSNQVVMEPKQRGFYYQYGRIDREPPLLRKFAMQGVLTQASLLRKRRRQCSDTDNPYVLTTLPAPTKKPKIPHRHGEFEQRRDDIIHRMRSMTMTDLEQKAQRLAPGSTLAIEHADLSSTLQLSTMSSEEVAELLEPSLRILTFHSNMKPHLDNGMNQNGIYYNSDYYRLYLAFIQFQKVFATLFPQEVVKIRNVSGDGPDSDDDEYDPLAIPLPPSSQAPNVSAMSERDRDRDRNMNMKAYRGWIEPLLTETNWAAFRRNIVVGERMVLLTKVVGQGVLLMTKELSGSKLHLTFTNSEWDEFIGGLHLGKWDHTVTWHDDDDDDDQTKFWGAEKSRLVEELKSKFASEFWFYDDGTVVPSQVRKRAQEKRKQDVADEIQRQREAYDQPMEPPTLMDDARAPASPSSSLVSDVPTTTTSSSVTTSTTAIDTATAGQITLSSASLPTTDKDHSGSVS